MAQTPPMEPRILKLKDSAVDLPTLNTTGAVTVKPKEPASTEEKILGKADPVNVIFLLLSAQLLLAQRVSNLCSLSAKRVAVFALLTWPIQVVNLVLYCWASSTFSFLYVLILGRHRFMSDLDSAVGMLSGRSLSRRTLDAKEIVKRRWTLHTPQATKLAENVYSELQHVYERRRYYIEFAFARIRHFVFELKLSEKAAVLFGLYLRLLGVCYGLVCVFLLYAWSLANASFSHLGAVASDAASHALFALASVYFFFRVLQREFNAQPSSFVHLSMGLITDLANELLSLRIGDKSASKLLTEDKQSSFVLLSSPPKAALEKQKTL